MPSIRFFTSILFPLNRNQISTFTFRGQISSLHRVYWSAPTPLDQPRTRRDTDSLHDCLSRRCCTPYHAPWNVHRENGLLDRKGNSGYSHQFWDIFPDLVLPLKIWHFNFCTNIWVSPVCKRLVFGTSILSQDKLKKCAIVQSPACLRQPIPIPNPSISVRCNSINTWRIRIQFDSVISRC
jgi:hypothetical protein